MTSSYQIPAVELSERAAIFPDCAVDGVVSYTADLSATFWNAEMERMTGVSHRNAIGRPLSELLPALFEIGDEPYFHDAVRGRITVATPHERIDATGAWQVLERHYSPLRTATGDIAGGLLVIRDISGEQAERSLAQTRPASDALSLLVQQLAEGYGMRIGFLGELGEDGDVRWRAVYDRRGAIAPSSKLRGGPCERVYMEGISYYPAGLYGLYPRNEFLRDNRMESYLAIPLLDSANSVIGHMGAMHDEPTDIKRFELLRMAAMAAGRELQAASRARTSERVGGINQWVIDEERAREQIASDLHDRIGQNLLSAKIKLDQLAATCPDDTSTDLVRECRGFVGETIADTRSLIFEICPPLLQEQGLAAALEWLSEQFQPSDGLQVVIDAEPDHKEPDHKGHSNEVIAFLFRSVRELLINVAKHAQAGRAIVRVRHDERGIEISVEDDGTGFGQRSKMSDGFGLRSMRRRLSLLGGELLIESSADRGSVVVIRMPSNQ